MWRGGAPYSSGFAAAYAGYRWGLEQTSAPDRTQLLQAVASELEALLSAGQHAPETYFVLSQTLVLLRDDARFEAMQAAWKKQGRFNWKVDTEFLTPEDREVAELHRGELVALAASTPTGGQANQDSTPATSPTNPPPAAGGTSSGATINPPATSTNPTNTPPQVKRPERRAPGAADSGTGRRTERQPEQAKAPQGTGPIIQDFRAEALNAAPTSALAPVVPLETKFALVIGNGESAIPEAQLSFAPASASAVKDALIANGGYAAANVDLITNATADQLRTAAQALADRLPNGATVFLYFSGAGANIAGQDFLAGVEASDPTMSGAMVRKEEVFRLFTAKGARVFSFFEVNRALRNGRVFGSEQTTAGSVSQMMATLEGRTVGSLVESGKEVGIFALGIQRVLDQLRTNSIPLTEFAWQVFYAMRGGRTALGSVQTPTLPVVTLLEQDARF
jgi:hypothetical protein